MLGVTDPMQWAPLQAALLYFARTASEWELAILREAVDERTAES